MEIDGVVVADEALSNDVYTPINLDFPPSASVPKPQISRLGSPLCSDRELNRRVRGYFGSDEVSATGADANYEAQNIASKVSEVSLAGVLLTSEPRETV